MLVTGESFSCGDLEQAPTPCSTTNYTCGPGASCVHEVEALSVREFAWIKPRRICCGRLAMTGEGIAILPSFIRRIAEFRNFRKPGVSRGV